MQNSQTAGSNIFMRSRCSYVSERKGFKEREGEADTLCNCLSVCVCVCVCA